MHLDHPELADLFESPYDQIVLPFTVSMFMGFVDVKLGPQRRSRPVEENTYQVRDVPEPRSRDANPYFECWTAGAHAVVPPPIGARRSFSPRTVTSRSQRRTESLRQE